MKLKVPAPSLLVSLFGIAFSAPSALAQNETKPPATYPALPSEIPAKFKPVTSNFDYAKRDVMIPMRDGVKLHTVILIPKGAKGAPILMTRTPYSADKLTSHAESAHLGPVLSGYDNALEVILEGGYVRVVQDVRGKHGSEGDYIVNRPLRGPLNPTPVDHATDTYDTIDWLVKNIPESNGKVGILGISYDGYLPLMALVDPHPALKVSVPMNPMVDGWIGDDWFHYGAFRQMNVGWIYNQVATRKGDAQWWRSHYDQYDMYMQAGSAGELGRRRGLDQLGFWNKLVEHPAYDAFWRDQAVDKLLAAQPLKTPVMLVHSLWDQEDIYGAPAVYKAIEPKDTANDKVFLVMGPWHHGQMIGNGSSLSAVKFGSDTALYFRKKILAPFLAQYLKDGAPKADIAPVTAFETGTNVWRRYSAWPPKAASDKAVKMTPLYLRSGLKLSHAAPKPGDAAFEEYVSDPAKPVPFQRRPVQPVGYEQGNPWPQWLADDQREASGRPDVVTFVSATLTTPTKIAGEPIANLVASTSGTDADWVVKLIDVYPDEVGGDAVMGGYQLMIAGDIFRGRFRESFATAKPIASDTPLLYRFALPTANHVFLPGHRIMVQIQSSWFPLYDRNPQTFVPNIFWAKPGDYRKATQRIYHTPNQSSFVELPVVVAADGLPPKTVRAKTHTATALTPEAVWDAISAAKDGDIVQLPEGTAVWKSGWNTKHWSKMKAITIQGAGIDKTIIRDDTSRAAGDEPFLIHGVEGKPFRITGITFDGTGLVDAGVWAGEIVITGNCKNFRVDHCKFLNMDRMITIDGDTYGLIDHCYFHALEKNRLAQTIMCMGPGKAAFTKPLTMGTDKAVYFEDNEVHFSPEVVNLTGNNPWIVPYQGARVVIRHNKVINSQLEIYRVRPGAYGCRSAEIYDNAFSTEGVKNGRPQGFIMISGGVTMVFNNTVTGTTYNCRTIELSHDRAFRAIGEFGICDGTNPLDGNQIPAGQKGAGYPALGQPGGASDSDGNGVFKATPCYAWNNTYNGAKLNMTLRRWPDPKQTERQAEIVKEGRDFFNEAPKDEFYKPYTYPHPLSR